MKQTLLCFLAILAIALCEINCPAGYSNRDQVHCYKVYTTPKSKSAAAAQCESDGGYLSSISNGFDNSYVNSLGQNAPAPSMWLGIQCYNTSKSSCVNDHGSSFGPYDNFYPGNPSVMGTCVYMSNKSPTSGNWLSFDCDNAFPFLCEFDYGSQCQTGHSKYRGSCYRVVTIAATEVDAELTCQKDCGHLASIHSVQENNFLTNFSATYVNSSSHLIRIGLTGTSSWYDGWTDKTPLNYTNYGYVDKNIGPCYGLSLDNRVVNMGQWLSESCDSVIPYVCKTAAGICQPGTPTQSPPQCNSPKYLNNPQGTGTVYSPGYPGSFGYNPQCVYFITTTPGFVVEIYFSKLQLVASATILLYNDVADETPFARIDSSTTGNFTYKSKDNEMVLVFSYPSQNAGGQWQFTYGPAEMNSHQCRLGYSINYGACYKFMNQQGTKSVDSANCKADGGNLAAISSIWTNQFLVGLVKPYNPNYVYIGLQCPNVTFNGDTSSCVWDDGTPFTYNGFQSGNPTINTQTCAIFNNGIWQTHDCNDNHYSICETPLLVS